MVITFNAEKIDQIKQPTVIKVFATWCPHCNKMKPIFEKLSEEFKNDIVFGEIDSDKEQDLVAYFKVDSLPTFIFLKDQQEVGSIVGEMSYEDLKQAIVDHLK